MNDERICFYGDSTFLLKVAHEELGDKCVAVTAMSCSSPQRELEEAKAFCQKKMSMVDRAEQLLLGYRTGSMNETMKEMMVTDRSMGNR